MAPPYHHPRMANRGASTPFFPPGPPRRQSGSRGSWIRHASEKVCRYDPLFSLIIMTSLRIATSWPCTAPPTSITIRRSANGATDTPFRLLRRSHRVLLALSLPTKPFCQFLEDNSCPTSDPLATLYDLSIHHISIPTVFVIVASVAVPSGRRRSLFLPEFGPLNTGHPTWRRNKPVH
ncbi:hypothetical protein BC826DRAFT_34366 [Russula brevipes]|nr:hypothetical protein BC826DRAFT_34366 [Russula brevipes]